MVFVYNFNKSKERKTLKFDFNFAYFDTNVYQMISMLYEIKNVTSVNKSLICLLQTTELINTSGASFVLTNKNERTNQTFFIVLKVTHDAS